MELEVSWGKSVLSESDNGVLLHCILSTTRLLGPDNHRCEFCVMCDVIRVMCATKPIGTHLLDW